jgi:hypothetical protein
MCCLKRRFDCKSIHWELRLLRHCEVMQEPVCQSMCRAPFEAVIGFWIKIGVCEGVPTRDGRALQIYAKILRIAFKL